MRQLISTFLKKGRACRDGVVNLARETQARLGIETVGLERMVRQLGVGARKIRRPLVLLAIASGASWTPPVGAVMPVFDALQSGINDLGHAYTSSQNTWMHKIEEYSQKYKAEKKWLTDVAQAYRTMKNAKTMYNSIATFDLAQDLTVLDLLPNSITLPEGNVFGGPDNGFSSDENKERYVSMRLHYAPPGQGVGDLFSGWEKFDPHLKINVGDLGRQLANLDFDLVQMVQYKDSSGNPLGAAIEAGDAKMSYQKSMAYWSNVLKNRFRWKEQDQEMAQGLAQLDLQVGLEQQGFEDRVTFMEQEFREKERRSRKQEGITGDVPSQWDLITSKQIALARVILNAQAESDRKALEIRYRELSKVKTENSVLQQLPVIEAQIAMRKANLVKLKANTEKALLGLVKKYKVMQNDSGESGYSGLLGLVGLKTDDLKNLKLPVQGENEAKRLLTSYQEGVRKEEENMKENEDARKRILEADKAMKPLEDLQKALADAPKDNNHRDLISSLNDVTRTGQTLQTLMANRADVDRAAELARQKDAAANYKAANERYFTFQTRNYAFGGKMVLTKTADAFKRMIKAFVATQTVAEVMKSMDDPAAEKRVNEEWKMNEANRRGGGQ